MAKRRVSYGKCFFCEQAFAKNAITRHLQSCPALQEFIANESGKSAQLFHLLVEGRYEPEYWLHIEIPASSTLVDLDDFLRSIWLECCGHLSQFTIDDIFYSSHPDPDDPMSAFFGQEEKSMKAKLYSILDVGDTFVHEYDFGTTTELKLKMISERKGVPLKHGVRVLARNYAPVYPCVECGKPAKWFYVYEYPFEGYCDEHAEEHDEFEEGFLPVVNSPRSGECGYDGPFDDSLEFEETYSKQ